MEESNILDDFISSYGSKASRTNYKCGIKKFFKFIDIAPEEYLYKYSDYNNTIIRYARYISKKYPTPKSYNTYINIVRQFHMFYEIEIKTSVWKQTKRLVKGNKSRTQDRPPTAKEMKQILAHSDLRMKALLTVLVSSGMRIGEALKILPEDIDFEYTPTKIQIRGEITKTGEGRTVFISNEATYYLKEWLSNQRSKYLKWVIKTTNLPNAQKKLDDDRIFPFTNQGVNHTLRRTLSSIGLGMVDRVTKRRIIHFHVLRKFFRSKMGTALPQDITECLLGHEGYLSTYRYYSIEELAKYYLEGMHLVSFTGDEINKKKIKELYEDLDKKNSEIKKLTFTSEMNRLRFTLLSAKSVEEMENALKRLDKLENKINSN